MTSLYTYGTINITWYSHINNKNINIKHLSTENKNRQNAL